MFRWRTFLTELRNHIPFTLLGTLSGMVLLLGLLAFDASRCISQTFFWVLHPTHVLLSAMVTTRVFRQHRRARFPETVVVGLIGSIGIATLSDCLIPFAGESLLGFPHRAVHVGFIERWWLVNPLAVVGVLLGFAPRGTELPHAGHVLLSTTASLFHMSMAWGPEVSFTHGLTLLLFLFLSVWIPCCASDIAFPMLFSRPETDVRPRLGPDAASNDPGNRRDRYSHRRSQR